MFADILKNRLFIGAFAIFEGFALDNDIGFRLPDLRGQIL